MLWQIWKEPPPVGSGTVPEVGDGFSSLWEVVVAVKLAGAALMVVAKPLIVVRTGVIVATGLPLASTETQGLRGSAVTM
jgi:hypothetical protein